MRRLFASLPVLVLACGGSIGPVDPGSLHIAGSYDFTTSAFNVDTTNSCCIEPNQGHPILTQHARLDIQKTSAGFVAVLTPDFGDPQEMSVVVTSDKVTLTGSSASFSGGGAFQSVTDSLDTIVLPIGNDGKLAGTYTGSGQENVFEGDVGWQGNATAAGAIGADTRAPQAQASVLSSATSVVLPWDTLYVRSSEPVMDLQKSVSLTTASGNVDAKWTSGAANSVVGDVSMTGNRTTWGSLGPATLAVASGLTDPSANASATGVATPLTFLDVPKGAAFTGAAPPAMWGKTQIATGTDACGTASSCVEIGPLNGPCTAEAGGLAVRLDATAGKTISVTYRMRVASQYGQPYFNGAGFSVATPGSAAQTLSDPNLQATFAQTTDATYNYATDWVTATLPAPASPDEIGLALLPFGNASMYCGGGPAMPPVTMIVDVAAISMK
jgi:hypothetical protein